MHGARGRYARLDPGARSTWRLERGEPEGLLNIDALAYRETSSERFSEGDYYEAGFAKALRSKVKLDVNYFRRFADDSADDDQIENTSISFPVSFRKAAIYGVEGKLDVPEWNGFSGFLSYSYQGGRACNRRTVHRCECVRGKNSAQRALPHHAGSAQHGPRAASVPGQSAALVGWRSAIRQWASIRV